MRALDVIATSDESMAVDIKTPSDPTAEAAPAVSVVAPGGTHSTFTSGSWGTWDATLSETTALLPSPLTLSLSAGRYVARVRWSLGAETPIYEDLALNVKA